MNLKTKMKNFFTLTRKANGGFTLVELIVVIAILAILGGVAVPAYSGYVKKANMQADKSLAADVAHALTLYYYSHPDETVSGYVVLKPNGEAATGDGVVSGAAMQAVFGDNWEDVAILKYDGWPSASAMLSSALDAGSLNSSSYITNSTITELLGNVQTVTSAAAELLGSYANKSEGQYLFALENAMGTDYMESAVATGVLGKDENGNYCMLDGTYELNGSNCVEVSADLQNQLSNLMVFGVANQMGDITNNLDMANLMLSGPGMEDYRDEDFDYSKYSKGTCMAAQYALYKAYAVDCGAEDDFDELNKAMSEATSLSAAEGALADFANTHKDALAQYIGAGGSVDNYNNFMNNADAVIQVMNGVTAVSPDYTMKETLTGSNLFASDSVTNDLDVFVSMAKIGEALTDTQKAELKTLLANNPNAVVFILANGMAISTID